MSALSALGQAGSGGGLQQLAGAGQQLYQQQAAAPAVSGQMAANSAAMPATMAPLQAQNDATMAGVAAMAGGGEVGIPNSHPMVEGAHPVWGLLHHIAGSKQAIPSERHPVATMSGGGAVTPVSKMPPTGPLPANFGGAKNYQTGGPVLAQNSGSPTLRPDFNRGPTGKGHGIPVDARPLGTTDARQLGSARMNANGISGMAAGGPVNEQGGGNTSMGQGITPASTEGQILTMDQGGQVPLGMPPSGTNWTPPPAMSQPQVSGRAAGFASGLGSGMALGKDLRSQWQQHEAQSQIQGAQSAQEKAEMDAYRQSHGLPTEDQQNQGQTGIMGTVHNYTSQFFDMLHGKSLDDKANLNTQPLPGSATAAQPGQAVQAPPPGGSPPTPPGAPPPGGTQPTPPGQSGIPGPPGQPGTPGAPAPAAGAVPPAGPRPPGAPPAGAPPAGAPPGGAPPAPPQPAPGTPIAAASKAQTGASQAGADPVQAAQTAASVGNAAASLKPNSEPAQVPGTGGTPESLTSKDWEDMERAKWKAARAATAAGMDGNQVYESMSQLQTAHFQGQYMKWIGNATQALQNGDQDGVEKALKASSYYLPNGQPLQLHKATDDDVANDKSGTVQKGQFVVQNPFYGMPGHDGANEPRQVGITPMSLASMGQAAMDPVAFGTGLQNQYKMGVEAQTNLMKANAAQQTGGGRYMMGQAAYGKMLDDQAKTPDMINDIKAQADLREATAERERALAKQTGGGIKVKPSDVEAAQKTAADAFDNAAQGPLHTTPAYMLGPDGKPMTDPTTGQPVPNPHGNQPSRDPTQISPLYRNLSPQERNDGRDWAGMLHSSNLNMTPQECSDTAARIIADKRNPGTHINPQTGKPEKNVVPHNVNGMPAVRVWANGRYINAWTTPNVDTSGGESSGAIESGPSGGRSGGGSTPSWVDQDDASE